MKLKSKEEITRYYNEVVPKVTKMVESSASVLANTENIIVEFPSLAEVLSNADSPVPYFLTGVIKAKVPTKSGNFFLIELAAFTFDFNRADLVQFDDSANQRKEVKDHLYTHISEIEMVILFLVNFSMRGYAMHDYATFSTTSKTWRPGNDIDLNKVDEDFYAGYTLKQVKEIVDLYNSIKNKKL